MTLKESFRYHSAVKKLLDAISGSDSFQSPQQQNRYERQYQQRKNDPPGTHSTPTFN